MIITRLLVLFLLVSTFFASSCIQSTYTLPVKTGSPHEDIEKCLWDAKREALFVVTWDDDSSQTYRKIRDRCKSLIPYETSMEENQRLFPNFPSQSTPKPSIPHKEVLHLPSYDKEPLSGP